MARNPKYTRPLTVSERAALTRAQQHATRKKSRSLDDDRRNTGTSPPWVFVVGIAIVSIVALYLSLASIVAFCQSTEPVYVEQRHAERQRNSADVNP